MLVYVVAGKHHGFDRKTQKQIVKELKNCLGCFKSAQPDYPNYEQRW